MMGLLSTTTTLIVILSVLCALRLFYISKRDSVHQKAKRSSSSTCGLAVFLGSGGHSTEALALVSALNFSRYTPRTYIISDGDNLSSQKARELEERKREPNCEANYTLLYVPRARMVHQPLWTTPPSVLISLAACVKHTVFGSGPSWDVLILNGPGTCLSICAAVYINRFLGLPSPRVIYIESFARVRSLSLSGKLLRPFVDRSVHPKFHLSPDPDGQTPDRFIVQWPNILERGGRGQYFGCLV